MQKTQPKLSVIGLGKLGSPMVAVFAHKGYDVIGVDLNSDFVEALRSGKAPVEEPQLQDFISRSRERIDATLDYDVAIAQSDITFIIVPTPSGSDHLFSNKYVIEAVTRIGHALRKKSDYHLVVVTSTVMPGSTDGEIRAALEGASGRKVGTNLGLCYNPEFIALGSVIRDMLNPDMILIGESDVRAGQMLEEIYARTTESKPEIHRMNLVNAELTKISVNTFVTTKISYANMIADMCDRLPRADADVVNRAVGADSRIGRKYLKSAIGYGGPCFPRDNKAFAALGRGLGARCDLAEATDRINDYQLERLQEAVTATTANGQVVSILGLAYKPDTCVIEASQGVMLAKILMESGFTVIVYDPLAMDGARAVLGTGVRTADSLAAAIRAAHTVVIMTAWPTFKSLPAGEFVEGGRARAVIDPWRVLSEEAAQSGVRYIALGKGTDEKGEPWQEVSLSVA